MVNLPSPMDPFAGGREGWIESTVVQRRGSLPRRCTIATDGRAAAWTAAHPPARHAGLARSAVKGRPRHGAPA